MCQFKHEKTKELCGYYAGSGECYKFQDGMCPNMHSKMQYLLGGFKEDSLCYASLLVCFKVGYLSYERNF